MAMLRPALRPLPGQTRHPVTSVEFGVIDVADASELSAARAFTRAHCVKWSLADELADDAELVVSELVTNALVHGRPPARVVVAYRPVASDVHLSELICAVANQGRWRQPREHAGLPLHGRGLLIVRQLCQRVAIHPDVSPGRLVVSATLTANPPVSDERDNL